MPTVVISGVFTGRWWKPVPVVGAAILGLAIIGVGVAIHQGVVWLARSMHSS
ncbi:MAG: hypothetical protein H5T82_03805 [Demequina sp.]|uniref:hypothetical protein n=1 Tax=Demequina sp. TaxID=2050685 RepID=UPI001986F30B|nr:hypothetical protein [Demequina sp.]MBC7297999.1 hypothetical protein [Demequina sp.]